MKVVCLDLEGVLIPEIWIDFAKKTGIDALMATTRDIPDYDVLMKQRLRLLDENQLTINDIQAVIASMQPLEGARQFLDELREHYQVIILSDTFYDFAAPFMAQLGQPTLFCHRLQLDNEGRVEDYILRQVDPKRHAVIALKQLNFTVYAAGDSYNDTSMLAEADAGFLFRSPENVISEFSQFPHTTEYEELRSYFDSV
jgi:phosphoserine/homoserine phosphotransferase